MPYITQERRNGLREPIDRLVTDRYEDERVEDMLYNILTTSPELDGPVAELIDELIEREHRSESVGGDINFCLCRLLVGLTQIHVAPRYESKIQWIQERLEAVGLRVISDPIASFVGSTTPRTPERARQLGILSCVKQELYSRYAVPYEAEKCRENGDIMD